MTLMELLWDPRYEESVVVVDVLDPVTKDFITSVSGSWANDDILSLSDNTVSSFDYIRRVDILYVKVLNDN